MTNYETPDRLTRNEQNKKKRGGIPIAHIVIESDGWVWVSTRDGHEMGLGDIGVDVEVHDRRGVISLI